MRQLAPIIDRLAVGAVLALAIFVLAKAHRSVDYWTVAWPGVLTGCGTLALAAVTYRVLVGDQEDRRKRDLHDQKQAEQERRAQAEAISGWYAGEEDTYSDAHADASPPTKMFILNRSDSPVYRVVLLGCFDLVEPGLGQGIESLRLGGKTAEDGCLRSPRAEPGF
jgi:hypothetical protein